MANQNAKSEPIVIKQPGMDLTIEHRQGLGGEDEGLSFDVTTESEGKRIIRFDCFYKDPHYHIGTTGERKNCKMKNEGITDPVSWSLEQLKTRLPSLVRQAGYESIAATIDQQFVAAQLSRLDADIRARY
ncbi:MAG: hypothetical protein FJ143_03965 [Deltaproteobacteria bacterium]|nr:hypothetical protein [Deltaproteobacteria bacterium]MBM4296876.1 hypothetical protein [Deltaproteobacteria bacterium]